VIFELLEVFFNDTVSDRLNSFHFIFKVFVLLTTKDFPHQARTSQVRQVPSVTALDLLSQTLTFQKGFSGNTLIDLR